jgi:phage terminase small subunit
MAKILSPKQQSFVWEYLRDFNGTQAARRAGYQGDDASLAVIASQNLRKPRIVEIIHNYLAEKSMGFEEVLFRLTRQARASIGDFLQVAEDGRWDLDLQKAFQTGAIDMVEKLILSASENPDGTRNLRVHLKLYDAQKALIQLGKAYGVFKGQLRKAYFKNDTDVVYYPPPNQEPGPHTTVEDYALAWENSPFARIYDECDRDFDKFSEAVERWKEESGYNRPQSAKGAAHQSISPRLDDGAQVSAEVEEAFRGYLSLEQNFGLGIEAVTERIKSQYQEWKKYHGYDLPPQGPEPARPIPMDLPDLKQP